jgi:FkbM family methyltransferase
MHLNLAEWSDRSTYFLERWYDLETQLLMKAFIRAGDTVIDVGANRGMFALTASHLVGKNGQIICFEPNQNCLKTLRYEIESNQIDNIVVHQLALGSRDEEMTLSVPKYNSGQGTLANDFYARNATYPVRVQIRTGDDILKGKRPSFIKIDVEGFESSVLSGLSNTIRQHRPIIVTEISPGLLVASGSSFEKLATIMSDLNYRGYRIGSKKRKGQYDLYLSHLDDDGRFCDAVWLHSTAHKEHAEKLCDL